MTPRELDGWAPEEVHEHFDAEGVKTGFTVVTREPRVSPEDRAQMVALDEYEAGICSCGCGQPLVEAMSPDRAWVVNDHVCYAKRAVAQVRRKAQAEAERVGRPDGWDDGITWLIQSSHTPDQKGGADRG